MAGDKNRPDQSQGEIVIYQAEDGLTKVECRFVDETVWLTQQQMAELFHTSRSNIVEHIGHIYEEGELDEVSTCRKFRQVRMEGNRQVTRELPFYNLDMIISLGYRVKSLIATQFRRWATERLKEYMIKGFTLDDERLKNLGGGNYWHELLERIRDIRSSEKVMYRQVLDLYATSVDYNPRSAESVAFFKMVQNKMHWAVHRHTAAELIVERANAEKEHMGLTTWESAPDGKIVKADVSVAKNYLSEKEMSYLERIVSLYLDYAELQAERRIPMSMEDWAKRLDGFLEFNGNELLMGPGKVSAEQAKLHAETEFEKYRIIQDRLFMSDYDKYLLELEHQAEQSET